MSEEQAICYNCGCPVSVPWPHGKKPTHWSSTDCVKALKTRIATIESTMKLLEKTKDDISHTRF